LIDTIVDRFVSYRMTDRFSSDSIMDRFVSHRRWFYFF
jgi:hypothetical protein